MTSQAELTLLGMPSEIRLRIFEMLMCCTTKLAIFYLPCHNERYQLSSQVLRTCRILHKEGATILYGKNLFSSVNPGRSLKYEVKHFAKRVGSNVTFVKRIEIFGPRPHDPWTITIPLPELVTILPHLKDVTIYSRSYDKDERVSEQDCPEVTLADMRSTAQEAKLREPEWQGSVNVFIRRYYFGRKMRLVKVGPLLKIFWLAK